MPPLLIRACSTAEIPLNSVKRVAVAQKYLAVYNIDGAFYATDDECTHAAASLADGLLEGDVIECSMHFGAFHVPTGKPVAAPCSMPLRTYGVVIEHDDVFVELDAPATASG
jgi:ethylbenzene dioxygenase ferredoxin component